MSRPLVLEDLFKVERLSDFCLSSDGKFAWIISKRVDLENNRQKTINTYLDCETGRRTEVVLHEKGASCIRISRDSKHIVFAADGQVYYANADGSDARCVTHGKGGAGPIALSSDGTRVVFVREQFESERVQKISETGTPTLADIYGLAHPKANARIADKLFYRHWDEWCEKRRHLFIVDIRTGEMRDLTPADKDVPAIALCADDDFDISPDGKHIVYVMNPDDMLARSTNQSIYLQEICGIEAVGEPVNISNSIANDGRPRFISNTKIAYGAMLETNSESDDIRLKVYDLETGMTRLYLERFERSLGDYKVIAPNKIMLMAQDFAHSSLYELDLKDDSLVQLTSGHSYMAFDVSETGRVLVRAEAINKPAEIVELLDLERFEPRYAWPEVKSSEKTRCLTEFGAAIRDCDIDGGRPLTYRAKDGTMLEGWVVLPPNFDATKKYPLILLIHGGPQGAFEDSFHYRWNVAMFASRGAVVAFCNPRGSTGYGAEITRAISGRWSDECPDDILTFVDNVLEQYPCVDPNRLTAAGASFGGFMINWLMGHTDRFKAFVSHDGIFNTEMAGYITDELWFSEHEFGGKPFECPDSYLRHSPHRFVSNFKTPTLVVQGEKDYRCFISEGVGLFTALQYMGVESRLLYFHDEGHWVLSPADSYVWYSEVIHWLMSHANA